MTDKTGHKWFPDGCQACGIGQHHKNANKRCPALSQNKSTREIGDKFEQFVLDNLPEFRATAGSGSVHQDGDMVSHQFIGECKVKGNCGGFSASGPELNKLKKEATKHCKDWLFFEKNAHGEEMVLMNFHTFLEMYESWISN